MDSLVAWWGESRDGWGMRDGKRGRFQIRGMGRGRWGVG